MRIFWLWIKGIIYGDQGESFEIEDEDEDEDEGKLINLFMDYWY